MPYLSQAFHRLFVVFALACSLNCIPLRAQTSLNVGNTPGFKGTIVSVPITVIRASNLVAAQFDISYDTNKVSPAVATASLLAPGHFVRTREVSPGVRRVVTYAINSPLSTDHATIGQMPFLLSDNARGGSGPITPGNAILANQNAAAITPLVLVPGVIFGDFISLDSNRVASFFLSSELGEQYLLQASTDLTNWITLSTNVATGDFLSFSDIDARDHPYRFYRAKAGANP